MAIRRSRGKGLGPNNWWLGCNRTIQCNMRITTITDNLLQRTKLSCGWDSCKLPSWKTLFYSKPPVSVSHSINLYHGIITSYSRRLYHGIITPTVEDSTKSPVHKPSLFAVSLIFECGLVFARKERNEKPWPYSMLPDSARNKNYTNYSMYYLHAHSISVSRLGVRNLTWRANLAVLAKWPPECSCLHAFHVQCIPTKFPIVCEMCVILWV